MRKGGGEPGFRRPALVLFFFSECIWNAPAVSLVLPAFDETGSHGSPPRRVVYHQSVSTLGDFLSFSCSEYGGWIETHHFLFTPFPCFPLSSSPSPQRYSIFECCLLGLLFFNNNNNNIYIYLFIYYYYIRASLWQTKYCLRRAFSYFAESSFELETYMRQEKQRKQEWRKSGGY